MTRHSKLQSEAMPQPRNAGLGKGKATEDNTFTKTVTATENQMLKENVHEPLMGSRFESEAGQHLQDARIVATLVGRAHRR